MAIPDTTTAFLAWSLPSCNTWKCMFACLHVCMPAGTCKQKSWISCKCATRKCMIDFLLSLLAMITIPFEESPHHDFQSHVRLSMRTTSCQAVADSKFSQCLVKNWQIQDFMNLKFHRLGHWSVTSKKKTRKLRQCQTFHPPMARIATWHTIPPSLLQAKTMQLQSLHGSRNKVAGDLHPVQQQTLKLIAVLSMHVVQGKSLPFLPQQGLKFAPVLIKNLPMANQASWRELSHLLLLSLKVIGLLCLSWSQRPSLFKRSLGVPKAWAICSKCHIIHAMASPSLLETIMWVPELHVQWHVELLATMV